MSLKILHTGDIHIGMKFNSYPEQIREKLVNARFEVVEQMVAIANEQGCNIIAITGDLFENTNVTKETIVKVINVLKLFHGECILIMPGNHDYDDGIKELWERFDKNKAENMLLLNENKIYSLESYGLNADIYPAYCNQRHSAENNLQWIKESAANFDKQKINIGLAHGALEGLSADIQGTYFFMKHEELEAIPVDLWLVGHTHIPYPNINSPSGQKIYNCGTPEPDGLNYRGEGNAWVIDMDENGNVKAQAIKPGKYKFYDETRIINNEEDMINMCKEFIDEEASNKIVRLDLKGYIEEDLYANRQQYLNELEQGLFYFIYDDSQLRRKITIETIKEEFSDGSFPHRFLSRLAEDEDAMQIAYELLREVK